MKYLSNLRRPFPLANIIGFILGASSALIIREDSPEWLRGIVAILAFVSFSCCVALLPVANDALMIRFGWIEEPQGMRLGLVLTFIISALNLSGATLGTYLTYCDVDNAKHYCESISYHLDLLHSYTGTYPHHLPPLPEDGLPRLLTEEWFSYWSDGKTHSLEFEGYPFTVPTTYWYTSKDRHWRAND